MKNSRKFNLNIQLRNILLQKKGFYKKFIFLDFFHKFYNNIFLLPQPTSFGLNLLMFKTSRIIVAVSFTRHCTYCRRVWRLKTISNVLYILLCKCICAVKSMRAAVEKLQKNSSFQTVSLNFSTFAIKRIKTMYVRDHSNIT